MPKVDTIELVAKNCTDMLLWPAMKMVKLMTLVNDNYESTYLKPEWMEDLSLTELGQSRCRRIVIEDRILPYQYLLSWVGSNFGISPELLSSLSQGI